MPRSKCTTKLRTFQEILGDVVREANARCQFSQRKRECDAETFVQTLVFGWLEKPGASLEQLATTAQELGCQITKQGLDQRINPRAVVFLAYVLAECLRRLRLTQSLPIAVLARFAGVYITDSTQIKLPDLLVAEFPGSKPSYAMVKWQVTMEYLQGIVVTIQWEDGKEPDQKCSLPVDWAQKGSLQLFDLGYFKQERLGEIAQKEAYFVCRYQSQTAIYDPDTGERIALARRLRRPVGAAVELFCLLGRKQRLPVRLIARRLPRQEAAQRRRKARKKAKQQGKACTKTYLQLLGWEILVTNLPAADYPPALVFALYGIRWQIELVFKTWKSQLKVALIGHWRAERVLGQLYAILIGCVLCHWWTGDYRWWKQGEQSMTRMIQSIQRHIPKILRCIARQWYGSGQIFKQIEGDFLRHARKEKRKKSPSTLQTLMNWGLS